MGKNAAGGKKHAKPHKKTPNTDRPNGKAWKKGLAPDKRN